VISAATLRADWKGLHWLTKLVVIAAAARLAADTVTFVDSLGKATAYGFADPVSPLTLFATTARAYSNSLLFLASAATVELLYRIWRELRKLSIAGLTATPSTPGLDTPAPEAPAAETPAP
jgi:hypothetical protein